MTEYRTEDIDHIRDAAPVWISPEGAIDILVELLNAGWRPPLRRPEDGYPTEGPVKSVWDELMIAQYGEADLRGPVAVNIVRRLQRDGLLPKDEDEAERRREVEDEFDRSMDAARREAQRVSALENAAFVIGHVMGAGDVRGINPSYVAETTLIVARHFEPYVRGDG